MWSHMWCALWRSSWRHGSIKQNHKIHFLAQMYAVSYVFQRFQPCWNHSKAFHAIQCQHVGYIIDIWGILGHYLVFYYESNWESSVKALVVCCATYGCSGNIASRLSDSLIFVLRILSSLVTPSIRRRHVISKTWRRFSSSFFTVQKTSLYKRHSVTLACAPHSKMTNQYNTPIARKNSPKILEARKFAWMCVQ